MPSFIPAPRFFCSQDGKVVNTTTARRRFSLIHLVQRERERASQPASQPSENIMLDFSHHPFFPFCRTNARTQGGRALFERTRRYALCGKIRNRDGSRNHYCLPGISFTRDSSPSATARQLDVGPGRHVKQRKNVRCRERWAECSTLKNLVVWCLVKACLSKQSWCLSRGESAVCLLTMFAPPGGRRYL